VRAARESWSRTCGDQDSRVSSRYSTLQWLLDAPFEALGLPLGAAPDLPGVVLGLPDEASLGLLGARWLK